MPNFIHSPEHKSGPIRKITMMLNKVLLVLGGSLALTSAALFKPGVQFFSVDNWRHPEFSITVVPEDGVCHEIDAVFSGSMKVSHKAVRSTRTS